nr:MAG: hypothetical protein [Microvirus sp.]
MLRRKSMSRGKSRRHFSKNAGTHPKNNAGPPVRGGYRM